MNRHRSTLLAVAISCAFAAPAIQAQQGSPQPSPGATSPGAASGPGARAAEGRAAATLARADRQFLMQAAEAGMAEVRAGELASQKASSPQVRQFAQRMVDDHTKANRQLMQLAEAKGVKPPDEPDRAHRQSMERMQKLSGAEFDRAYMKSQVDDHQNAVSLYERQAKNGRDDELKSFAQSQLPALREHLEMARSDLRQIDAAAGRGAGTSASRTPGESMTGSGSGSGGGAPSASGGAARVPGGGVPGSASGGGSAGGSSSNSGTSR